MIELSKMNREKMYQRSGWALIAAIWARSPVRNGGQAQPAASPSSGAVISEAAAAAGAVAGVSSGAPFRSVSWART
jgi:hypothetical protein